MKLLLIACPRCGAQSSSPFGLCPDCELRRSEASAAKRRVREQSRRKRVA
jgi:NMD protein affecting ribosome stability and mRNA decay